MTKRFKCNPWAVSKIVHRYNPEYDVPQGCPEVSWVEYDLLQMILELEERISALEEGKEAIIDAAVHRCRDIRYGIKREMEDDAKLAVILGRISTMYSLLSMTRQYINASTPQGQAMRDCINEFLASVEKED